jgi:sialate O-acetylesterase
VAADANAALVASLDIGEPTDIHPANKVVLGQRLALAAQGQPMPMPLSARRTGNEVTVTFSGVEGSLESLSGAALAFELCGATQESCRFATGTASGNAVRLPADGRPVTRVRHAWADSPVVNTYDKRALPVPGFEIAVSE